MRSDSLVAAFAAALVLIVPVVACGGGGDSDSESTSTGDEALTRIRFGANGDDCAINLDSGLKEPGTEKDGKCCSVFRPDNCVDIPKVLYGGYRASPGTGVKAP